MTVHTRQDIFDLLAAEGRRPRRDLGQNFVADPNTVRRIARMAGVGPGDHVVEIGAGLGSLTLALAETGACVTAVEVDRGVLPTLRRVIDDRGLAGQVEVVEADATRADWTAICDPRQTWALVANLPYNVATPLVCDLLDGVPQIATMLVMVQREVGERMAAGPGSKTYGAVSVKIAYWATATVAGAVPATVFVPRPNVDSVLVAITRRATPATDASPEVLFDLVRAAFGQRRKMLRRSLAGRVGEAAFAEAGIDPTARPEQLDVVAWGRLAAAAASGPAATG